LAECGAEKQKRDLQRLATTAFPGFRRRCTRTQPTGAGCRGRRDGPPGQPWPPVDVGPGSSGAARAHLPRPFSVIL